MIAFMRFPGEYQWKNFENRSIFGEVLDDSLAFDYAAAAVCDVLRIG